MKWKCINNNSNNLRKLNVNKIDLNLLLGDTINYYQLTKYEW